MHQEKLSARLPLVPASSSRARTWLRWIAALGGVALLWTAVLATIDARLEGVKTGPEATNVLLSSVNIGLILFSLVVAGLAMFGWQSVKNEIDEAIERRFARAMQEIRGRIYSATGTMQGDLSADPLWGQLQPIYPERAKLAAELCRVGYITLRDLGEGPELMALNNMIFYSTLAPKDNDPAEMLALAKRLREKGNTYKKPHLRLTYCRAVLVYSEDPSHLGEAQRLVQRMLDGTELSPLERKEAELYSAEFPKRIPELSG